MKWPQLIMAMIFLSGIGFAVSDYINGNTDGEECAFSLLFDISIISILAWGGFWG